jgi:hypothetical protein
MNEYYVYILRRPDRTDQFDQDKGEPFWVGKGQGDRIDRHRQEAEKTYKRPGVKSIKDRIIHKLWDAGLDYTEDYFIINCSEEDAFLYEGQVIEAYGRIDLGTGCLANRTNGSEIIIPGDEPLSIQELLKPLPRINKASQGTPHPLKAFFRSHGIGQVHLCNLLKIYGLHQSSLSKWLSGVAPMPPEIEERLQAVADAITIEESKKIKHRAK